ncbi:MAG: glycosyltransferase, partial [Bacteroidota bacterium]
MSENLVIVPTYNEKENIQLLLNSILSLEVNFDVLVVDDGSPDGTANLVRDMQPNYEGRIHLIERKGKLGLGTAYLRGFQFALENGYHYIFEMD